LAETGDAGEDVVGGLGPHERLARMSSADLDHTNGFGLVLVSAL